MAIKTLAKKDKLLMDKTILCNYKSEAERILAQKGLVWTRCYKEGKHTFIFANDSKQIAVWFRLWKMLEIA